MEAISLNPDVRWDFLIGQRQEDALFTMLQNLVEPSMRAACLATGGEAKVGACIH